jgi:hypothetical protein
MYSNYSIEGDVDNLYINLSLYNNSPNQIPAKIDVALEKPIVEHASNYKLSIIRFSCPLDEIPSYDLSRINPANIRGGFFYAISFIPGFGFLGDYYVYTAPAPTKPMYIDDFIDLLNDIFENAYNILLPNGPFPQDCAPYFFFDPRDKLIRFVTSKIVTFVQYVFFILHKDLFDFIDGFPSFSINPAPISDEYVVFKISQKDINLYTSPKYPTTPINCQPSYIQFQEYQTTYKFNDPQPTSQQTQNNNQLSYISSFPILTDFLVPINNFGEQFSVIYYLPTAEFRWADLIYDLAIDRLSFTFYYQTLDQKTYPLLIQPGKSVNIKIYLKSKKFFLSK